jgi:hypothetical protein
MMAGFPQTDSPLPTPAKVAKRLLFVMVYLSPPANEDVTPD